MLKFVNQLDSIFILLPMEEKAEGNFMLYGLKVYEKAVPKRFEIMNGSNSAQKSMSLHSKQCSKQRVTCAIFTNGASH